MKPIIDTEETRIFNQPKANAKFDFWVKADCWKLDEAIALSLGKDPGIVTWEIVDPYTLISPFAKEFEKRRNLAQRAVAAGRFSGTVFPPLFVSWAIEKNLDIPPELKLLCEPVIDGVTLENLAVEIAAQLALADSNRGVWDKSCAMSQTISITLHKIGMPIEGSPAIRPHILKMVKDGAIAVRCTRNNLPPVNVSDVTAANFGIWYVSHEDADKVRARLQGKAQAAPTAKVEERISVTGQQDNAILNWLKLNEHDPQKVPVAPPGKAGVRKECGDAVCKTKALFSSRSVFNTAWDRLRANGDIANA